MVAQARSRVEAVDASSLLQPLRAVWHRGGAQRQRRGPIQVPGVGDVGEVFGEDGRSGQLVLADAVRVRPGAGAQLTDPDAAIAGADEDGAVSAAHDGAGTGPLAGVDPCGVRVEDP